MNITKPNLTGLLKKAREHDMICGYCDEKLSTETLDVNHSHTRDCTVIARVSALCSCGEWEQILEAKADPWNPTWKIQFEDEDEV